MRIVYENNQKKFGNDLLDTIKDYASQLCKYFVTEDFIDSKLLPYLESSYFCISFVSQNKIRSHNSSTRGVDKVTDVLSFPMLDMKNGQLTNDISDVDLEFDEDGNKCLNLGDILICLEVCQKNAFEYGHTFERETAFLIAHSMLHLFGFDHIESNDDKTMIFWQRKLMTDIGLAFEEEIEFVNHNEVDSITKEKKIKDISFPAGTKCDHCGYVAILGRPNVGKSTFLNFVTGMKLAIVSHKPQTTRTNIRSIYNTENAQVVFVDSPGVHKPNSRLSEIMVENSFNSAKHADIVLLMVDGRFDKPAHIEKELLRLCKENKKKVILAVNKSDDITKESLLPCILEYSQLFDYEEIIPISAKDGDNIDVLLENIIKRLPAGPRLFDSEEMTNQNEREISSELIREQILHYTNQEIPHGVSVSITKFDEKTSEGATSEYDRDLIVISADIICERKSHKGIILGKDGQMIKRIGTKARQSIERLCGCKVYLDLFVKVREDWRNDNSLLKQFGYFVEED